LRRTENDFSLKLQNLLASASTEMKEMEDNSSRPAFTRNKEKL
jgi:hypothetical protein